MEGLPSAFLLYGFAFFGVWQLVNLVNRYLAKHRWKKYDISNVENQLRFVSEAAFSRKRLMNKSEYCVFRQLENWISQKSVKGYRLFAQVPLGEFLGTQDNNAFRSINSKRSDFLIIDKNGYAVAAVECQGDGHFQGNARERDAVKFRALERAGVRLIEIRPGESVEQALQGL